MTRRLDTAPLLLWTLAVCLLVCVATVTGQQYPEGFRGGDPLDAVAYQDQDSISGILKVLGARAEASYRPLEETYARLPEPEALVRGPEEASREDEGKDKRNSYMSLCHFKICNMGRKRNMRLSPLVRVPAY